MTEKEEVVGYYTEDGNIYCAECINKDSEMKLPGLKARVSFGLPGFAGFPTLRSGRHSSPGLKPGVF
jgi:hypothetical protein